MVYMLAYQLRVIVYMLAWCLLTGVLWRVVAGVLGARGVRDVAVLRPSFRPQGVVRLGQQQRLLQAVSRFLEKTSVLVQQKVAVKV